MFARRKQTKSKIKRASPEERLYDYARGLRNYRNDRRAVVVRMSSLGPEFNQARYRRAAMDSFRPLMMRFEGILVELHNGDIICGLHGASFADMDAIILKLRMMFRDDDNLKAHEETGGEDIFAKWYEIERDYDEFLAMSRQRYDDARGAAAEASIEKQDDAIDLDKVLSIDSFEDDDADDDSWDSEEAPAMDEKEEAQKVQETEQALSKTFLEVSNDDDKSDSSLDKSEDDDADPDRPGIRRKIKFVTIEAPKKKRVIREISANDLEKIASAMSTADLTNMVRRENVMLVAAGGPPTPVFADRYVPINLAQETFLPDVDLKTDRWFMRHLREIIERRTLAANLDFSDASALARGFRISIDTVDSYEFEVFQTETRRLPRNQFILEFSLQDIVSNIKGFMRARTKLKEKGFRLAIGDMDPYTFTLLDRSNLHVDFEKIRWDNDFASSENEGWQKKFMDTIKKVGHARVVMVNCKSQQDLDQGHRMGINLFQGPFVSNK